MLLCGIHVILTIVGTLEQLHMDDSRLVENIEEDQYYISLKVICVYCVVYMLFLLLSVLWSTCMGGSMPVYNIDDRQNYILLMLLCGIHVIITIVVTLEQLHRWLQSCLLYRSGPIVYLIDI